jgi:hypothetical protein
MLSPLDHGPERKIRTVAADRRVDTAALLGVIALIGLAVFLLWDRHHSLRQARHMLELQHQSQGKNSPVFSHSLDGVFLPMHRWASLVKLFCLA